MEDIKDSTKGVKQPGFRQLSDTMVPIVAQFQMDDALLTVYRNSFVIYIRNDMYSIFAADRMKGMLYRSPIRTTSSRLRSIWTISGPST